ncbi:MAG: DUF3015 family protein [Bdellovibrionota bacterium]
MVEGELKPTLAGYYKRNKWKPNPRYYLWYVWMYSRWMQKSSWKTAAFVDSNMNKFARDISRGEGESLDTFASLLGVKDSGQE